MQIVILSAVISCLLACEGRLHPAPLWAVVSAVAAYWIVAGLLSRFSTILALTYRRQCNAGRQPGRRGHRLLVLATYAWIIVTPAAVIAWGYGHLIFSTLAFGSVPLVGHLLILALPAVAVLIGWLFEYPAYRAGRQSLAMDWAMQGRCPMPIWTRRQYLDNNIRHHLLFVLAPISLIFLVLESLDLYVFQRLSQEVGQYVIPAAMLASVGAVFLLVPPIIVRIWRTQPLPDGPLRRDLEEACDNLGVRFGNLLIWKSGGVIANAGVVGLLGRLRYILLSDALLANCSVSHIRAIFAHETAHILHRHIFYAVMFVASAVTICNSAAAAGARWLGYEPWLGQTAGMALAVASLAAGFGWLSRRFERQSDVTAAWLSDQPHPDSEDGDRVTPLGASTFASALEQIALINGIDRYQRNWRHGSIAWRTAYVLELAARGGTTREIGVTVRRAKLALWTALAIAVATMAWEIPGL